MHDNKKLFWIFGLIAVFVVGAIVYFQNPADQQPQTEEPKAFDPMHPNFIMGEVVSAAEGEVVFLSGPGQITAKISSNTKLVKQVPESGTLKVVPASISDFKEKLLVVVYFSQDPENSIYQADKLQIIQ